MAFFEMYLNGQWVNLSSFGTVSSVAVQSNSNAISVTGSPITSIGTIGLSFNPSQISLDQFAVPLSNLSLNNYRITNLANPISAQDGATKYYIDNKTWTSSSITDFSAAAIIAAKTISLDQFTIPAANLNLNNYRITNVANPVNAQDVATKAFVQANIPTISVTGAVIGTSDSQGVINTALSQSIALSGSFVNFNWADTGLYSSPYSLLNFLPNADPAPIFNISSQSGSSGDSSLRRWVMNFKQGSTATVGGEFELSFYHSLLPGDHTITPFRITYSVPDSKPRIYMKSILDMYNYPIVGVPTPMVGDGAANKDYIDNKTWTSSSITNFSDSAIAAAKTISLDQFIKPASNLDFNNKIATNAADPVNNKDLVNKQFLLNTLAAGVPLTLTGAVTGSGTGTISTALSNTQTVSNASNNFTWTYNYQPNVAGLVTTNQTIINDSSIATARLINRISRKTASDNSFEIVNWIDAASIGSSAQIMNMNFVNGSTGVSPAGQTYTFFTATKANDNTCNVNFNASVEVPNGTLSTHAVNKSQLDSKELNTLPVTGDVNLGTYKAISSGTPTSSTHLTNKAYVDSVIASSGGVWQTYTPNILASNTNPTLPTGHYIRGSYRVTGKSCLVSIIYTNNGSLTNINNGSGYYIFTLPPGMSIDTTKIYTPDGSADPGYYNAIKASVLGYGIISNGPNQIENNIQVFCSQTQFGIPNGLILFRMTSNIWKTVNNGSFPLNASSWITYQFTAEFPIL